MNKIAILLPDLCPGGAERLHLHLAREWLRQGFSVDFVLRQAQGSLLDQLPAAARVIDLKARRIRHVLPPLKRYLQQESPTAILAAMWPLTVIAPLAAKLAGYRGRVVVSEHSPQSLSYAARGPLHNRLMASSMRALYSWADGRVAVSAGVADDMAVLSGMSRTAFTVIHNPAATGVDASRRSRPQPLVGQTGPILLTVGTLKAVKRHDLLLRAFAQAGLSEARLYIVGEGPERPRLEALVTELRLQDRVLIVGYQADPAAWYAFADLFVLCSDHEGFGNVIVEALEQGVPVISSDCPGGPREILGGGKFGTLVPVNDVDALAAAMRAALQRPCDRAALRKRAADFSVGKAADSYLQLLLNNGETKSE